MPVKIITSIILFFFGVAGVTALLPLIAPDSLVVIGEQATVEERDAGEKLAVALQDAGGKKDNLVTDNKINADLELAASHHLFIVGTEKSNSVMARVPSHWALNRDYYYATHEPVAPFEPTKGFYLAGYGTFFTGTVGYIECDRNPYWHYASNLLTTTPKNGTLPYRQIIRLYGDSPAGVVAAVNAFLTRQLLSGPITRNDLMPDALTLWTIDSEHFAAPEQAPSWLAIDDVTGEGGISLSFAGWHLADSMTYAGFQEMSGLPARKIWRAKYLTEKVWNYPFTVIIDPAHPMTRSPLFEASLARRASDNEFIIARLASANAALEALKATENYLNKKRESHAPWSEVVIKGHNWSRSKFGVHITTIDDYILMESFDDTHDALIKYMISFDAENKG